MGDELKPCPFCGGEAYFDDDNDTWGCIIRAHHEDWCPVRDWPAPPYDRKTIVVGDLDCCSDDREKAIAAWNNHAGDAESTKELNRAAGNWARADAENRELRELIGDMHSLLQRICESRDDCCEFWQDRTKQCDLRDIEDKMRELGIEVRE